MDEGDFGVRKNSEMLMDRDIHFQLQFENWGLVCVLYGGLWGQDVE